MLLEAGMMFPTQVARALLFFAFYPLTVSHQADRLQRAHAPASNTSKRSQTATVHDACIALTLGCTTNQPIQHMHTKVVPESARPVNKHRTPRACIDNGRTVNPKQ